MIHTIRTVAVGDQESKIDSPIILYRGDREVEVEFTINGSKFTFTNGGNVIKSTNATHGQLVINTPTGENMFSEVTECHDGKVVFVITKEMIDELIEVGFYSFQIRLFDESQVSRVTIPPVLKGIDIRNPIAAEDETNVVDIGLVDYAVVVKDEFEDLSTFLQDGNYNKTEWESKDVISGAKLNKIEDALYHINSNMEASDSALLNRVENINRNVYGEIKKLSNDLETEVENFKRDLNNDIQRFKVDIETYIVDELDSMNAKMDNGVVYIRDFNDASLNDDEILQNAFDFAKENYESYTIVFENRNYRVNKTIENIDGVNIIIDGNNANISLSQNPNTKWYTFIYIPDSSGILSVKCHNLNVDGSAYGLHYNDEYGLRTFDIHAHRVEISNCNLTNIYGSGMNVAGIVNIHDNYIYNCSGLNYGSHASEAYDNYGDGIRVYDEKSKAGKIYNNYIVLAGGRRGRAGIVLEFNVTNVEVSSNYISGYGVGIHLELVEHNTVRGNAIVNNRCGVLISSAPFSNISNNRVTQDSSIPEGIYPNTCLYLYNGFQYVNVSDNILTNKINHAVITGDDESVCFSGNTFNGGLLLNSPTLIGI